MNITRTIKWTWNSPLPAVSSCPCSDQTKYDQIAIFGSCGKHLHWGGRINTGLLWIDIKCLEWRNMSTHKNVDVVDIISLNVACSGYSWNFYHLVLNNNHSLLLQLLLFNIFKFTTFFITPTHALSSLEILTFHNPYTQ